MATLQLEVEMLSEPYRMRNDAPSISEHEKYRLWVIRQFEERCALARAEQAEREAPRPAEQAEREAPRPAEPEEDML